MAAFTSRSVPGFIPEDMLLYTTPVQVTGHAVNNLTIAQTPLNKAIFGWSSGGIFYCAVRNDFEDVWRDDVVPDGDERVVVNNLAFTESALLGSLWVDRGELYCAVKLLRTSSPASIGRSVCYVANDVENPTSWTERGVISTHSGVTPLLDVNEAGPPTILDSGRWVLPFPVWGVFVFTDFADRSGLSISDDRGISWTVVISHRRQPIFSATTGPLSSCVGLDPNTGYLYWSHYDGPVLNQTHAYESTDDGSSWTILPDVRIHAWHYNIDNNTDALRIVGPGDAPREWSWYDNTANLSNDSGWNVTTTTAIPSRQAWQFQTHVFLAYGDIAYVDTNRVARQPLALCTLPTILFIPFKDRLSKLELDTDDLPSPPSLSLCAQRDFDNMKKIERWAGDWMRLAGSASKCDLFIPYKDHLFNLELTTFDLPAIRGRYFDNMKKIERWAHDITDGLCACSGPAKCRLFIPYKNAMANLQVDGDGVVDAFSLAQVADQDFSNYNAIERWANDNARGVCATGSNPFPPPPAPPIADARLLGEIVEVSTLQDGEARIRGEVVEVSTQQAGDARLAGEIIETSTQQNSEARLAGEIIEVAIVL